MAPGRNAATLGRKPVRGQWGVMSKSCGVGGRSGRWRLLASSSMAALLVGGGVPAAVAGTCTINITSGTQASVSNSAAINCIYVNNATVTGNVTNTGGGVINATGSGIPTRTGITIDSSTIGGTVSNSGTINANASGILIWNNATVSGGVTNSGTISAAATTVAQGIRVVDVATFGGGISNSGAISVVAAGGYDGIAVGVLGFVSTFSGGISNSGTISAPDVGIQVYNVASFAGGIVNSQTISGVHTGIWVHTGISTFAGGITNSGTIAASKYGIVVSSVAVFGGASAAGITNSGKISAGSTGIVVEAVSTFSGGISNSGTISAGAAGNGIVVGGYASTATIPTISNFSGGITNPGTISAGGAGIFVGGTASVAGGHNNTVTGAISTFSGGITNSGTISAGGAGVWVGGNATVRGASSGTHNSASVTISTFAGGITNSGTISAGGAGIFVGGNATVRGGLETFNIASLTISSFSGGISNSGVISAGGAGIEVGGSVTVSGGQLNAASLTISTFAGGIINSGTISAGGAGIWVGGNATRSGAGNSASVRISTFSGSIANSGTILAKTGIVVGPGVATFVGAIVNSGTITGTGGTAIDLSAAPNDMTVDIAGGTISGNIIGAGTTSGDTVNFNLGSSFAYANTISGVQTVNIDSGTLFDGGAITAAGVVVNSGGTLGPGLPDTTGSMSIAGNLSFSGGDYEIQLTPSAHASATVSGDLSINNGTVALSPSGPLGTHYSATTFSILTYGGTLGGAFDPNVTYTGAIGLSGRPTISYVGDNVNLSYGNVIADLATPAGASRNQQNVINGINNAILGGDTIPAGFQQLGNLNGAGYLNALNQLDGEDATGAATGAFTLMDEFLDLLLGESGGGGPGAAGGGLGFAPDQQADALPPELALAYDTILKAAPNQTFQQRWSTWASGFGGGSFLQGNAAVGSNNVNATTYGSAAGMEYRPDPNTRLGFALAGSGLNWGLAQGLGTGRSDAFQAGVYAKSYFGPAYVSAALAFGNNWFTTNRTALGDQLTATFAGQSYAARAEGGYRFALPMQYAVIGVTPYAALQTQWLHTPSYSETDLAGGGLGLTYNSTTANDTRSELGARFDDLTAWNNKPLLLNASLAWAHDWESGTALNATFESLPGSAFTVNGAPLPPNSALTTASAQYFFTPNWSFTAKFDGEFAPTAQTYAGSGTLKYTW